MSPRPRTTAAVCAALTLAMFLVLSPMATTPAPAAPPPPAPPMGRMATTQLLRGSIPATGGMAVPILRLPTRWMRAGQSIYVRGQMGATTNVPRGPMMGIRIICLGGSGGTFTVRNHDGRARGIQYVVVRWVFTAPHNGNYTCELRAVSATMIDPRVARLNLVPGHSRLAVSPVGPGAQGWFAGQDTCVGTRAMPRLPRCSRARSAVFVMARLLPAGSRRHVTAMTDVQMTREYGKYPGGPSRVRVTLEAIPATSTGRACAAPGTVSRTATITTFVHHYKVNLSLPGVRVNRGGGCGVRVLVRTRVDHLAGNPVTIHDHRYSNAGAWIF